jgi:predicted phage tail protein
VTANGPEVLWRPTGCSAQGQVTCVYRVRRRQSEEAPEKEVAIGDVEDRGREMPNVDYELKLTDTLAEWEHTYVYRVTPITRVALQDGNAIEVEGDDSQPAEIRAHDVFPPATPSGVQAVYSGLAQQKFIDLTWAPNTDNDLAGYYVYRHEQGAAPVKISADMAKTPAFRDGNIQPGHTYYYSVTAIDLRGNESQQSAETSENVPQ